VSEPTFISPDGEELEGLEEVFEDAFPESYQRGMLRARPYDGQPNTDHGERGKTEIKGITFRDLRDCFIRACCLSAGGGCSPKGDQLYEQADKGENALLAENDIFDLPWEQMDAVAIAQNLSCEVERIMGIYPNTDSPDAL
jgi:hypothetical protein